jgi:predicted Ser/Thr protein kinase
MGTVYKARHRELERPVAVKVLHSHLQQDEPAFAERFLREARTLARLDHPHIVRVYDVGHREGVYYLVMEFVDGVTLQQAMSADRFTPAQALSVVPRICEALQYAHDQGVVHRDIKPENILLDSAGSPKIADFGLALLTGNPTEPRLTQTAQVMGTPHYMAPEQIENPAAVDHRADIYAVGVVFYELLTGELPVGRFPPPSHKVEVDVRLDQVVLRTLEKEPRLRYQQASDLSREVRSLSAAPHPPATPPAPGPAAREQEPAARGYQYRSSRTIWGIPLLHIAFARDPNGARISLARGVVAIGDAAVGLVAIGGFAAGGVAIGGMSVGVITLAGISAALLLAIGGIAFGGFAIGSLAFGIVATGALPLAAIDLSDRTMRWLTLAAWALVTALVTGGGDECHHLVEGVRCARPRRTTGRLVQNTVYVQQFGIEQRRPSRTPYGVVSHRDELVTQHQTRT